jgi:hypothetical protein
MSDEDLNLLERRCKDNLGTGHHIGKADEKILELINEIKLYRSRASTAMAAPKGKKPTAKKEAVKTG